jgi:hypothetical protein
VDLRYQIQPNYWSSLFGDLLKSYAQLEGPTICKAFSLAVKQGRMVSEAVRFKNETKLMLLSHDSHAFYSELLR